MFLSKWNGHYSFPKVSTHLAILIPSTTSQTPNLRISVQVWALQYLQFLSQNTRFCVKRKISALLLHTPLHTKELRIFNTWFYTVHYGFSIQAPASNELRQNVMVPLMQCCTTLSTKLQSKRKTVALFTEKVCIFFQQVGKAETAEDGTQEKKNSIRQNKVPKFILLTNPKIK